ncbi:hypothetical protein [Niveibacterium umoris]|uniref:Uncharacterized protein n=1 Tax=Niveibacterium umoris TaxID=1193620 RepID=A0A840BIU9_9RHOO|nr:hypothetical protein [Niveibacterium umoris]MBB4010846.1 hypothetical protein [Niveibacterium umoris]
MSLVVADGLNPCAGFAAQEIASSPETQALRDALVAFYDRTRAAGRITEAVEFYFVCQANGRERLFGVLMAGDKLGDEMMLNAMARSKQSSD